MTDAPSNIVKYSSFSLEDAEKEEAALAEMNKGKFHKLHNGKNKVRFLPAKLGAQVFVKASQHFVQVGSMERGVSFNCPRKMANQPCLVCNDAEFLGATGSSVDYDLAGKLFANFRVYGNVIDREHPEIGPVTLAFGKKVYDELIKIRKDEADGGDFTDPVEGFDIIIEKSGELLNTRYAVRPSNKGSTPLGDNTWIDIQADLSRYARVPTTEELATLLASSKYESATLGRGGASSKGVVASSARGAGKASSSVGDVDDD